MKISFQDGLMLEKMYRLVAHYVGNHGFKRTRTTFYTRFVHPLAEFIYIEKIPFEPHFHIQFGLRVATDTSDAIALTGPGCRSGMTVNEKQYDFFFLGTPEAMNQCAKSILEYVREVGEPWFMHWRDFNRLLDEESSPLIQESRQELKKILDGYYEPGQMKKTQELLMIAPAE